jgi:hypothetical protein
MAIDLTGAAASPPDARRLRLLWLAPPLLLAAAVVASVLAYPHRSETAGAETAPGTRADER